MKTLLTIAVLSLAFSGQAFANAGSAAAKEALETGAEIGARAGKNVKRNKGAENVDEARKAEVGSAGGATNVTNANATRNNVEGGACVAASQHLTNKEMSFIGKAQQAWGHASGNASCNAELYEFKDTSKAVLQINVAALRNSKLMKSGDSATVARGESQFFASAGLSRNSINQLCVNDCGAVPQGLCDHFGFN